MRFQTIKRYLEHYPTGFIVKKLVSTHFSKQNTPTKLPSNFEPVNLIYFSHFCKNGTSLKTAKRIVNSRIPVFGSSTSDKINWNVDYVFGKVFGEAQCDVRIVWELNRFHFAPVLAEAYNKTQDKSFLLAFKQFTIDWIEKNPVSSSPNWKSSMEVSIRLINLCVAASIFYKSDKKDIIFWNKFFLALFVHADFIVNHLEWSPKIRNNHYLTNILGLLFAGLLFEKTENGKKWLEFASSEIQKEMQYQVLGDGVDFEKSTWYHGFATEMFLVAYLLMKKRNLKIDKSFENQLTKMFVFLKIITRSDGSLLSIGDNDSGRLFKNYLANGFEDVIELGNKCLKIPNSTLGLFTFAKSGFCIYRDAELLLSFFAGPTGTLETGGHTHNSSLAFTLDVNGKPIFIDPGAYIYTGNPKMRNLFRSTAYHNTAQVDTREQNYFDENELFKLFDKTKAEITFANKIGNAIVIAGRHYGYSDRQIVHERLIRINLDKRSIEIRDWFKGTGIHNLQWNFHCGNLNVKKAANGFKVDNILLEKPRELAGNIEKKWYSLIFGEKKEGKAVVLKLERVLMPKMFSFNIRY